MKKSERQIIFNKYAGHCAYCGCELKDGWHVDHIEPIVRDLKYKSTCEHPENNRFENYNPSCPSCNILKNSMSIESFRNNIARFVNSLESYSTQFKVALKYGLVEKTNKEVKFYFETYKQP